MAYGKSPASPTNHPSTPSKHPATPVNHPGSPILHPGGTINFATVASGAGATVLQAVQSDLGVTLNGSTVSAWADQSGNGKNYAQATGAKQPLFTASVAGIKGKPSLLFDGVSDNMTSTLNLPTPGTTPTAVYWVFRQVTWTSARWILGATGSASVMAIDENVATPNMTMFNGGNVNNNAATIGTWVRAVAYFSGSTNDYFKCATSNSTGASAGNNAGTTGREIASSTGTFFSNIELALLLYLSGSGINTASAAAITALDAAVSTYYGL